MTRLFTMLAFFLTALTIVVLFYIVFPISYDGLGKLGTIALLFTPQLIVIGFVTGLFAWQTRSSASIAFGLTAFILIGIGLWANLTLWQAGKQYGVRLDIAKAFIPQLNRGKGQAEQTVAYDKASNLALDVWPAKQNESPHPAIIRIHGGAWNHGERSEMAEWNRWLNKLGYTVFDIDYRLSPRPRWQDSLDDVIHAIDWVKQNAEVYKIDPERVNLMGYSAGGHLAMLAGYSTNTSIRTVINLYGPSELQLGYYNSGSLSYARAALQQYLGGTPEKVPEAYHTASPLYRINPSSPPTIAFLGKHDRIVSMEQVQLLEQGLIKAGVPNEVYYLPASDHGFDANWNSLASQFAQTKVKAFLEKYN